MPASPYRGCHRTDAAHRRILERPRRRLVLSLVLLMALGAFGVAGSWAA